MPRHGENIRKRSDGRWEARLVYTLQPDEKKIVKSFYGSTYAEAKQRRAGFLSVLIKGGCRLPAGGRSPAFRDVASAWMSTKALSVKTSTLSIYSCELSMYILPAFGDCPINSLDGDCIDDFLTNLLRNGRKPEKTLSLISKAVDNTSTEETENRDLPNGKSAGDEEDFLAEGDLTDGNMAGDSMKGNSMSGDSMKEGAMKEDSMAGDSMAGDSMAGD
ncbi:MAG: hypothetical protein LUF30_08255, partial [Lachnospiraceae bacterium]|nr:hypothetical protein [Lachnospiraceae bacterium]